MEIQYTQIKQIMNLIKQGNSAKAAVAIVLNMTVDAVEKIPNLKDDSNWKLFKQTEKHYHKSRFVYEYTFLRGRKNNPSSAVEKMNAIKEHLAEWENGKRRGAPISNQAARFLLTELEEAHTLLYKHMRGEEINTRSFLYTKGYEVK